MLKIYMVTPSITCGTYTYSRFIVAAVSQQAARETSPAGHIPLIWRNDREWWYYADDIDERYVGNEWVDTPETVDVDLLGTAESNIQPGIIMAEFIK